MHTYELFWVGPRFTIAAGGQFNPDLLFVSDIRNSAIAIEAKGGRNLDQRQLERAASVTITDLARGAGVSFQDPSTASFTYAIACFEPNAAAIAAQLEAAGSNVPLLAFGDARLHLNRGVINDGLLMTALIEGVVLPPPFPTNFIPFDDRSPPDEIAAAILAHIVARIASGEPHFELEQVYDSAIPMWTRLHPRERRRIIDGTLHIFHKLRETPGTEFRKLLRPHGTPQTQHLWLVTNKIQLSNNRQREVRFETLNHWGRTFLDDLRGTSLVPRGSQSFEGTQQALDEDGE